MLYDKNFLLNLDKYNNKIIYAKITALTFSEEPIESIEGRVTAGTVNLDGSSAIRRTCSLTIIANDYNYGNYYWGLNTKFKLEIGLENHIDQRYEDIIWFNQGIFILTSLNTSHSSTNFTIQLQGKDKMCLLNGEVGGALVASTDFGIMEETLANGIVEKKKIPIFDIIKNMIHEYAGEPYHNIIINDLDNLGLELLEYRYDQPMYLYRSTKSYIYENATLDGEINCIVNGISKTLKELQPDELDLLMDPLTGTSEPKIITIDGTEYYIAKIEFGQTAGYRFTDLIYAGDLIGRVGESITSILDKIKNMLGEFEYFYNVEGQFVFQRKKIFVNTLNLPIQKDPKGELYVESLALSSGTAYYFKDGELLTNLNNRPNLVNMRNDYSIWGKRISASGVEVPIHFRYAIDSKPQSYTNYEGVNYTIQNTEWREILYQMAIDYFKHHDEDDYEQKLFENNPNCNSGTTGYEQYYTDIQGFWRQLYCPQEEIDNKINKIQTNITRLQELIKNEKDAKKIFKLEEELKIAESEKQHFMEQKENYDYEPNSLNLNWNKNIFQNPESLNFWFDFLDTEGELNQFNVKTVGIRTKSINDSNVKAIYFRGTPEVIFDSTVQNRKSYGGYKIIQVPNLEAMFSISSQGKSAKDLLDELIYKHGYCIENVTLNTIPIYHLEPNTRIHLADKKTKLDGDYIVEKITIPLVYNGTMTISASKAAENIMG